jgi:molybdopterin converting factor small subunit
MNVTVKFVSYAKLTGTSETLAELPEGATVADLAGVLAQQFPRLLPMAGRAAYLVNQHNATRDTGLKDGDQVLMLQVFGGG